MASIDPNYANLVLGLHFYGANNGTVFADSSAHNRSPTVYGNTKTTTGTADPFGASNGVGVFDGSGDYLEYADSTDWDLTGDFKIRFWVYFDGYSASYAGLYGACIIAAYSADAVATPDAGWQVRINGTASSYTTINVYTGLTDLNFTVSGGLALNTWHEIEVNRTSGQIRAFANGTQAGSTIANTDNFTRTNTNTTKIGWLDTPTYSFYLVGKLSDLQVYKGNGGHTSNYTPATSPFPTPINLTPSQLALTFTGNTPTIPYRSTPAQLALTFVGNTPRLSNTSPFEPAQLVLTFTGNTPTSSVIRPYSDTPTQLSLAFTGNTPTYGYEQISKPLISSRRYKCTVTGAANSLPDVIIPISSINGRVTNDGVSTLSIVCPEGVNYAAAIEARAAGGFVIESVEDYSDGSSDSSLWVEYPITGVSSDRGAHNWSITISGSVTLTLGQARRLALLGVSYLAQSAAGKTRARCELDKDLLPGDVAMLDDGSEYTCSAITYVIGAAGRFMEVQE
jgi:hypothetical protein